MAEDRSLDDFAEPEGKGSKGKDSEDAERTGPEPNGDDAEIPDDDDGSETTAADGVEPAISTSAWTTGGVACERCGDDVERRWRDDDGRFVCDGCKEW